jgi:hypothetical protein
MPVIRDRRSAMLIFKKVSALQWILSTPMITHNNFEVLFLRVIPGTGYNCTRPFWKVMLIIFLILTWQTSLYLIRKCVIPKAAIHSFLF